MCRRDLLGRHRHNRYLRSRQLGAVDIRLGPVAGCRAYHLPMASPRLRLVADVRDQIDSLDPAAVCIGPGGDLWMIAHDRPRSDAERDHSVPPEPQHLTVLNFREGVLNSAVTVAHAGKRAFVQPLGPDRILLVAARTAGQPNARVVDSKGSTVSEFILGDGIEDVQTTRAGDIWVSYYDQGTFMGCWQAEGKSDSIPYADRDLSGPISFGDGSNNEHYGLLRTSAEGQVSWRFTNTETIEPIMWCDGLNAFGDGSVVWACYSIFPEAATTLSPVVRIEPDGARRVWYVESDPGRALAVHGETILLGGAYGQPGSLLLGRLGEWGAVDDIQSVEGIPVDYDALPRVIGRGSAVHWIDGTRWYVLDLRD